MKLYIMRHGETDWNKQNRVLGLTDIPLNQKGIEQAQKAGGELSSVSLDVIYTSCFSRTIDTAKIISLLQLKDCPVIQSKALNEQNFGIFEGVDRGNEFYQSAKREFFKCYPNGESYFEVATRVYDFLDNLKKSKYQCVLLVTHGGICRVIVNKFVGMDNESFVAFTMRNCEIREFEI